MNCPNCNEVLLMTVRSNVEIDYCPKCRGIWLDKGELDKLLTQDSKIDYFNDSDSRKPDYREHDSYRDQRDGRHYKKKKSFLNELFDF